MTAATPNRIREAVVHYRGQARSATLTGPADFARFVRGIVDDHSREHLVCVWTDSRRRPIGWHLVSLGTANASLVHPREVYQLPMLAGAISILLAHNHPSGDVTPSPEDYAITRRIAEAGILLGVALDDHVVFSAFDESFSSIRNLQPNLFGE